MNRLLLPLNIKKNPTLVEVPNLNGQFSINYNGDIIVGSISSLQKLFEKQHKQITNIDINPIYNIVKKDVSNKYKGSGIILIETEYESIRDTPIITLFESKNSHECEDLGGSIEEINNNKVFEDILKQNAIKESFEESAKLINIFPHILNIYYDIVSESNKYLYRFYIVVIKGNSLHRKMFIRNLKEMKNLGKQYREMINFHRFKITNIIDCLKSGNKECDDIFGLSHPIRERTITCLKKYLNEFTTSEDAFDSINIEQLYNSIYANVSNSVIKINKIEAPYNLEIF